MTIGLASSTSNARKRRRKQIEVTYTDRWQGDVPGRLQLANGAPG
jgi:hypothetical protein